MKMKGLMSELVGQVRSGVMLTSDRLWLTGTGVALMNELIGQVRAGVVLMNDWL
jgi:hypothetical protein